MRQTLAQSLEELKADYYIIYNGLSLHLPKLSLDGKVNVCFLTASELYYKEFRKEEYFALDKELFIHKPVEDEELIKEISRLISKIKK